MGELASIGAMGGANLLGTILTNQANQTNAQNQMNFQAQMSDTAYQRQVADMKAAGLNPMFAMGSGGASSPSGSMATSQNALQAGTQGAAQGKQLAQAETALDNATKQTQANVDNQNKSTNADVILKAAQTAKTVADKNFSEQQTANAYSDSKKKQFDGSIYDAGNKLIDSIQSASKNSYQPKKQIYKGFDLSYPKNP